MGKLQTGRFERLSARTYSIKGPGALVDLDETVLGVIQLERQAGMEAHWIQGWETFGSFRGLGSGGASVYNWMLLANPPGSGRICVFDWYQRSDASRMEVFVTRGIPPGFVVTAIGDPLDTRIPTARQPACTFHDFQTNIGSFGTQVGVSANSDKQHFPVVLAEDGSIAFRTGAVNEGLELSVRWAEREAQPFEQ